MKRTVCESGLLLALALVFGTATALLHPAAPPWSANVPAEGEVPLETVAAWGRDVLWVDARSREVYDQEHVPGAVLLNEDEWEDLFGDFVFHWNPDRPVVIYCSSRDCRASHRVAERLRQDLESDNIHVLHGGWETWKNQN